jgi:hypothetical protein
VRSKGRQTIPYFHTSEQANVIDGAKLGEVATHFIFIESMGNVSQIDATSNWPLKLRELGHGFNRWTVTSQSCHPSCTGNWMIGGETLDKSYVKLPF